MFHQKKDITGSCYCGLVSYRAKDVSTEVSECHCSQCRRQSGHRYAVVESSADNIEIQDEHHITWFRSSEQAERGFCSACGSHLFWRSSTDGEMAILAASIHDSEDFRLARHIFVRDKGAYYQIDDDLPKFEGYE